MTFFFFTWALILSSMAWSVTSPINACARNTCLPNAGVARSCCVRLPGACGLKCSSCCKAPCSDQCRTIYIPRSPHTNNSYFLTRARRTLLHIVESDFDAGYAYQQSFNNADIAACLFGGTTLSLKGSAVSDRTTSDLLADQFGLSPQFEGVVTFNPQIVNNTFHFQGIWYNETVRCPGFFARGQLSVTHQKRSLFNNACFSELLTATVGGNLPAGSVGLDEIPPLSLQAALGGVAPFGDKQAAWRAGRFLFEPCSATNLSGITIDLGYAALHHDVHAYSFFLRYRAPVGTHINGSQKCAPSLFFPNCEGYATHLFENTQLRTFDFKDHGCMSRYLLLKQFDPITQAPLEGLIPGVNVSTRQVRVNVPVQGEVTLHLILKSQCHGSFTIGYELYGKQTESVKLVNCAQTASTAYGIKGCEGAYYFEYNIDGSRVITDPATPTARLSSATASNTTSTSCAAADVNGGTSTETGSTAGIAWNNVYTGNGEQANAITAGTSLTEVVIAVASDPPQTFLSPELNLCSGTAPSQVSHKGIIAYTYRWDGECRTTLPYLSIGFEAEGSGPVCYLKQWSLWMKGGVTF